jgi:putative colanic acid biosynthesis acetyltransferase WcaF
MTVVNLQAYSNKDYKPGSLIKRICWFCVSGLIFKSGLFPFYSLKRFILTLFGARIGKGVIIKPHVVIKYPWYLEIGHFTWVGEQVWIDNLGMVKIGSNVCISQGAYLLTGNHNFKKSTFDLIVKNITIEDGVWIGAKSVVCPGITCSSHSVLSVGSILSSDMEAYGIYRGNPATKIADRVLTK